MESREEEEELEEDTSRPPADLSVDARPPADLSVDARPPAGVSVDARPPADVSVDARPPADVSVDARPPAGVPVDARPPAGVPDGPGRSSSVEDRQAPPSSLALGSRPGKKRLAAPALSLSLGRSESAVSDDDFLAAALSPSLCGEDDPGMDIDLDAMETPSDSESLHFPAYDLDLEEDLRRLGVARGGAGGRPRGRLLDQAGVGSLEQDQVDSQGTRWRCFTTGEPPQKNQVNMSVLEPYLCVLSHGGYYGDGTNDIIVFSSCYLPDNGIENYQYIMDNLFRYVVGTLELMVSEDYIIIYLCALAQRNKLPTIGWLRDCYTTVDRRLRKNLKGLYVVHPTWYIKALITIIKPFISSKFSRKLQFISSLQELSQHVPTERVQIPDAVRRFDENAAS